MRIDAREHRMSHLWRAVNADTGKEIRDAVWADERARLCGVYARDSEGGLERDIHHDPVIKTLEMNVRLEWMGDPEIPMSLRRLRVVALR